MPEERKHKQSDKESLKEREYRDEKGEIHHHTKKKEQENKQKGRQ